MKYERFQILSSARQELFSPDSPAWVSRVQLSLDLESGKRLLQTRLVNCSEKQIRQVFLRVICLGARRERLAQLELVPMPGLAAGPGRVFGDDKPVEIPVKGTVFAEVFAQRVRFADGSAWDEAAVGEYLAFTAVPVRPADPHYETLSARARSGNVRNDCYFRSQQGLWVCTCGLPNSQRSLRCVRCGADRLWLEKHMDPNLIDAPPPEKRPEPAPVPVPAVTVLPAPVRSEPAPPPTIIVQTPPEPEPEPTEDPGDRAGRIAALVLALLLCLGIGAFCAVRYLKPWLRYREALQEQAAGNYEQAAAIFKDLGDYRDSPEQIRQSLLRKGLSLMNREKYQQAMEIFESVDRQEPHIADCLYAMGVLAYNDKDPETALEYVEQLRDRFPDYEKTGQLAQYCYYSLGARSAEAAGQSGGLEQINAYQTAIDWFVQASDYEDSGERIRECQYRIARAYWEQGDQVEAVLRLDGIQDYKDAAELRHEWMYDYLRDNLDTYPYSAVAPDWLNELVEIDYPGAWELYNTINEAACSFYIVDAEGVRLQEAVHDLSEVYIAYYVEPDLRFGAVPVLACYELPDGREGAAFLNEDHSAEGRRAWKDIPFLTDCETDGTVSLRFYDARVGESGTPLAELNFSYVRTAEASAMPEDEAPASTGEQSPDTSGG
ncbi:MAG: tetratricopeptide repeat protein [Oscillospiraceae bacterium]|nr:tetratricopeptide repeat protein [Oscillospiraceae bacterium]